VREVVAVVGELEAELVAHIVDSECQVALVDSAAMQFYLEGVLPPRLLIQQSMV
jgi:hypothetical protein